MAGNNKLYRSQDKKIIAGVCAGLAEYLGWEVSMTRLAYVLISIFSAAFPGVIVYLVLWVVMPEK
ncbi:MULTISPECIES: PspC domain-containing protein [Roseivirga]|jgi:phage shock protein C|uniref:PspC family transcriptional regulator n=2 Tax=Roseivirga TaxID=290180 RepID=A0ABQ3IA03_9BACT|nr:MULTISPECIES: PspC domain-containing protein [Roseivirga]GHE68233.1 PspC family transcriptional regulator [Roseivirga thermotolerans]|tara:strand:- start:104938 stop:105132 length:195 start_codon:yes stop_codon:yes gene_type:complete